MDGVLWITHSRAKWRLLPGRYRNWNSVYKRFARWCDHGIWEDMHQHFADDIDMKNLIPDSTLIRAQRLRMQLTRCGVSCMRVLAG